MRVCWVVSCTPWADSVERAGRCALVRPCLPGRSRVGYARRPPVLRATTPVGFCQQHLVPYLAIG